MLNLIAVLVFIGVCLGFMASHYYRNTKRDHSGDDQPEAAPLQPPRESFLDRWEKAAVQAGLTWTRQTYFGAAGGALALSALLAVTEQVNLAIMVGLAGLIAPYAYVKRMQTVRSALFLRQLPPALFMAASVLRAGGTLLQAVESIAREMPDPMGAEFKRIHQKMRLQVPAHEAFAEAQARVGLREFAAMVVATRITAEVGGNLAHILDQISRSIVEAQNARRMIHSFTTEGRMSTNLIAALPFVVMGLMHFLSPGYFDPLFTTWPGRIVLLACTGTIALGWVIIRRMVDIRMF